MNYIEPYWNDPRVQSFRQSDAYPYVRGLAAISGVALAVSVVSLGLFAAGSFLLSVSEASFVIAKWSLIAAGLVIVGYYLKGYLEQFLALVQTKTESILKGK